jgi:hypothetical protein
MGENYDRVRQLIREGKRIEARTALEEIARTNPEEADAWYGLSQLNDDPAQKAYCLQRAYELRPDLAPKTTKRKRKTAWWAWCLLAVFAPVLLCMCIGMIGAGVDDDFLATSTATFAAVEKLAPTVDVYQFEATWTPEPVTPTAIVYQITPTRITFDFLTTTPTNFVSLPPMVPADYGPLIDVCDCSGDIYNCGDFNNHVAAQYCFSYCNQVGKGDVHNLDGDADGKACEDQ